MTRLKQPTFVRNSINFVPTTSGSFSNSPNSSSNNSSSRMERLQQASQQAVRSPRLTSSPRQQFIGLLSSYRHFGPIDQTRVAVEVEDIISNPPNETPYTYLRSKLMERLSASEEQRVKRLISEEELGDRKPSQFLRYLRTLIGTTIIPDNLLRQFWLQRLPSYVQAIITAQITAQPALTLDNQSEIADKIIEVSPATPLSVRAVSSSTSVKQESSHSALICAIESLSKQVAELSTRNSHRNENRSNSRGRRQRSQSRQDSGSDSLRLCWYHHKFHDKAKKYISPCSWKSGNADNSS
ncbi:uncharacterized protein LOC131671589 [Phymastichus coffea]|uniref:uncharacterized protein LOC131671589 n=1 Tax=Phymastichus coffea TaxID=108790 RepID=UPI00273B8E6A|nr:uncharacterized protein LOC131671589 [Phymastichus coffea]